MANQKTALISVYNKEGLLDLCKGLAKNGIRMISSGGTYRAIREAGFEATEISEVTGFKECLGGRVKTLHPAVHAGILSRRTEQDSRELEENGIKTIDYVICNLYPFANTVAKVGVTVEEAVEEIDIGGVTLLRAAAKNFAAVTVLSSPASYYDFLTELGHSESGTISASSRQRFALQAFEHTADYDTAIAAYFRKQFSSSDASEAQAQLTLRYGVNPHQRPASAFVPSGQLPFRILAGSPGYINILDSLGAWQLVKELRKALDISAAASFKHCSPAGAAVGVPLTDVERKVFMVDDIEGIAESPLAMAYARARGADRMSSFGDFIALSDICDTQTAKIISKEVSDGVIAPGYTEEALQLLSAKKGGKYCVLEMDPNYTPANTQETRTIYGITLTQHHNDATISPKSSFSSVLSLKDNGALPESALRDLTVAAIATKYTQSNSVVYAKNGQVTGAGAGQQSRIGCVKLAGTKSDNYFMHFHERALNLKWKKGTKRVDKANALELLCSSSIPESGIEREDFERHFTEVPKPFTQQEREAWLEQQTDVALCSDAFFPFIDNVLRCARSGVKYFAAPTGSQADQAVKETAEELGLTWVELPYRLFHH